MPVLNNDLMSDLKAILDRSSEGLELEVVEGKGHDNGVVTAKWYAPDEPFIGEVGIFEVTLRPGPGEMIFGPLNFRPEYQGEGFFNRLVRELPGWTRKFGVTKWVIPELITAGAAFEMALYDAGFTDDKNGVKVTDVTDPQTSRLDQFNEWVHGNGTEPGWHKTLPPDRRRTRK